MELIIDTKQKTLLIRNEVNLNDLLKLMRKLFQKDWIEWKIKSVVETEHYYPSPWWYGYYPYIEPYHFEFTGTGTPLPANQEVICLTEMSTTTADV